MSLPLIFEQSRRGRKAYSLPRNILSEKPLDILLPKGLLRDTPPELPEICEVDIVRHYTRLSRRNFGVDLGFYPLGSCTMKYNPKINEDIANLPGFKELHPYQDEATVQGALQILYETANYLAEISGMDSVTLQPAAGAQGELTGMLMVKAYHESKGEKRTKVIIPDSAHGTNPATAAMCGYEIVEVKSNSRGCVDVEELKKVVDNQVAALMLTNPNTLGLFEEEIVEIAEIIHNAGGLLYYDGANANAILGIARPGDMGFDIVHFNLHKTFSTPHGGGGPGSGPVGVKDELAKFLPVPLVAYDGGKYYFTYDMPESIGKIKNFYGNFAVIVRAYTYIRQLGAEGLRRVSETAVLNANYLLHKLKPYYAVPFDRICKHEFIISPKEQMKRGVNTLDIAKRLLDYGYHPPTIYFPLVVEEAMMIEPTETESKETLDAFVETIMKINAEINDDPEKVKTAPHTTIVGRLDEVAAARKPQLRWKSNEK